MTAIFGNIISECFWSVHSWIYAVAFNIVTLWNMENLQCEMVSGQLPPKDNWSPVRVKVLLRVRVRIKVMMGGGNFPRGQLSLNQWEMPRNIWSTVIIGVMINIHQRLFWGKAKNWFLCKNFFENIRNTSKQEIFIVKWAESFHTIIICCLLLLT